LTGGSWSALDIATRRERPTETTGELVDKIESLRFMAGNGRQLFLKILSAGKGRRLDLLLSLAAEERQSVHTIVVSGKGRQMLLAFQNRPLEMMMVRLLCGLEVEVIPLGRPVDEKKGGAWPQQRRRKRRRKLPGMAVSTFQGALMTTKLL
jgi:hypothetical protein